MHRSELTKEMFGEWKNYPVTVIIYELMRERRKVLTEILSTGQVLNAESAESTAINTAQVIGQIQGIDKFLELKFNEDNDV